MSQAAQELRNQGYSLREIGRMLKLHPSWVCRHTVPPAANDSPISTEVVEQVTLLDVEVQYYGMTKTFGEVCDFFHLDPHAVLARMLVQESSVEDVVDILVSERYNDWFSGS